ncbi:MAG TPA: hypothetical protein VMT18_01675, partial [Planctomycetota bacterium]|nr:hypothetical protein [Planctomycetota bacterium]
MDVRSAPVALFLVALGACSAARSDAPGAPVAHLPAAVWCVFQDAHGDHWFGSNGEGVFRFDGTRLARFTALDGLHSDRIRQIVEDGSGHVLVQTLDGIGWFDGRMFVPLLARDDGAWMLEPGDLWFAGDDGPYRYDGTTLHRLTFPEHELEGAYRDLFPDVPHSPYSVYTVYRDRSGAVWFGTAALGACRFDGRSFTWVSGEELTEIHDGPSLGVRGILEDRDDRFWIANTIYRYDVPPADGTAAPGYKRERNPAAPDAGYEAPNAEFLSALRDARGDVWLATFEDRVWRHDGAGWAQYPLQDGTTDVRAITVYEDTSGV